MVTAVAPLAASLALLAAALVEQGCSSGSRAGSAVGTAGNLRFEFTQPQMGLPFRIVLYAADAAAAEAAARTAFARISQLNDLLSDYDPDSELSRLSRTSGEGRAVPVSEDLWIVLERAQQLAARSDGAFDVTVGPYVNLWRKARRERKLPRAELIAEAGAAVGWEKLQLDAVSRTAKLLAPNMRLDLGGIAKGYAVDEAMKTLKAHGIERALVAGGGDMAASGPPPGQKGWRIEVAPLDVTNAPPARFVLLAHRALATSGDVFQRLEIDGQRYSHIVDPKTGLGLTDHSLVTVIAPDCTTADSLATAVSVLGPEAGLKLVEGTRGCAASIVRAPGLRIEVTESRRFQRYCAKP
jgi:thiamine biosynthesis lipoprotein